MKYCCLVCNYDGLYEAPYNLIGNASDEICPCCGFQYGYHDDDENNDKEKHYNEWREKWIKGGYIWRSKGRLPNKDWNPVEQLKKMK
ncbi:hypothetical protein ABE099_02110 [Paenibacillus turicensis]|uniref:hypothetical protein n=1 Tax=Paenibacillus turicensis TaxID=160487 RepID=UPI003D2BC19B